MPIFHSIIKLIVGSAFNYGKGVLIVAILYNSNYDETVPFSDVCVQFNLSTNTSQMYTLPGDFNSRYAIRFGYTENSNIFL